MIVDFMMNLVILLCVVNPYEIVAMNSQSLNFLA
jgi:hypothetical protein